MSKPLSKSIPKLKAKSPQKPTISITAVSENAVLITWPEIISTRQHQQIIYCQQLLTKKLANLLIDTVPCYNSLMVYYQPTKILLIDILQQINQLVTQAIEESNIDSFNNPQKVVNKTAEIKEQTHSKLVEIPVYYGEEAGWDLQSIAHQTKLSVEEVIKQHSRKIYHAYALGFTPGFCYLASIEDALVLPRKSMPRLKVPAGAVAIAQTQTAVYPIQSPGGWHIVGQTPTAMFSVEKSNQQTAFIPKIQVGDKVKFVAIDYKKFCELGGNLVLNFGA